MKARPCLAAGARGFTIIELMVVMVIAAVLLMVAIPSMTTFKRNAELTSATNNLVASINAARGEAMKRGMTAMVVPKANNDWSAGWLVFVDKNRNGSYDADTDVTVSEQNPLSGKPLSVLGTANSTADDAAARYLMFDASGYTKTKAGGFAAATMTIQRTDVTAFDQMRRVKIAQTGRVRSCRPASASDADCSDAED